MVIWNHKESPAFPQILRFQGHDNIIIILLIFSLWTPIDFGTRYQTNTTTIREEAQFIATAVTTAQHQLWDLDQLSQHHQWGEVRNTVSWSSSGTGIRNQWPSRTLRIMQPVNVKSIKDFQANWTVRERSLRCSIRYYSIRVGSLYQKLIDNILGCSSFAALFLRTSEWPLTEDDTCLHVSEQSGLMRNPIVTNVLFNI